MDFYTAWSSFGVKTQTSPLQGTQSNQMKLAKGLHDSKIVRFPDPQIALYRRKLRQLKAQFRAKERALDQAVSELRKVRTAYHELDICFADRVRDEALRRSDHRLMIVEAQLEQAIALATHFKELILKRPLIPPAVALGNKLKEQARRNARAVTRAKV